MKKFLTILITGLLWTNLAYTAETLYLICKTQVTENRTEGFLFEFFPEGKIVNAIYVKIKKTKSSVRGQFYGHMPGIGWNEEKPEPLFEDKGTFENGHYIFQEEQIIKNKLDAFNSFDFSEIGGVWVIEGTDKLIADSKDDKIHIDYDFLGKCTKYEKKEFISLRKKGVS